MGKCGDKFKGMDSFGVPVNFLIGGEDTFKTMFGAALTVIAQICCAGFCVFQAMNMI